MEGFLTTRETAAAIWLALLAGWLLKKPEVRRSVVDLVHAALRRKMLLLFALLAGYMTFAVWFLYAIRLWTPHLPKDTALWCVLCGFALTYSGVRLDIETGAWRRALAGQVRAILLLEYLVTAYTFALWIEMILFPVMAVVVLCDALAARDAKLAAVAKMTARLQVTIGLGIIFFALQQAVSHREAFGASDAIRTLALGPLLSIAFVPCIYVLLLVSAYEDLFLRLRFRSVEDSAVTRYARHRFMTYLGLRPRKVRAFCRAHALDLLYVATRADVDRLLEQPLPRPTSAIVPQTEA